MSNRSMDAFGSEDLSLPELKLAQATGAKPADARPGDFFVTLTDQVFPAAVGIQIVIVDVKKSRTYWGRTELDNEPPMCSSEDMITGQDGKVCETCEFRCDSPWLLPAADRRTKCTIHYTLFVINKADQMPMVLRASGISTGAVKQIVTALRMNRALRGEYHKAIISLTSEAKKSPSGTAYAMNFKMVGLVTDPAEASQLLLASESLIGAAVLELPAGTEESPLPAFPEKTEQGGTAPAAPKPATPGPAVNLDF